MGWSIERRVRRLLIVVAVVVAGLTAPAAAHGAGSIAGNVTDEAAQPIAGLCVATQSTTGSVDFATTSASGDYLIDGLAPGTYGVQFNWCGSAPYVSEFYDDKPTLAQADLFPVTDGVPVENIDAELAAAAPKGSISGRVTDDGGQPLDEVCVAASETNGASSGFADADANGDFSITGLAPGEYFVVFNWCDGVNYVQEYYDDQPDYSTAQSVTVTGGADTPGIDASLDPAATISGTVTDGTGPLEGVCVQADSTNPSGGARLGFTDASGAYSIDHLAPGNYRVGFSACFGDSDIWASEWWDDQPSRAAADPITVATGENASGKDAVLAEGGRISGRVTDEGGSPIEGICVSGADATGGLLGGARTDANGDYTIEGFATGDYAVSFGDCDGVPPSYASEYYDDRALIENADPVAVTLGDTTTGIDAVLGLTGAISGTLTLPGGGPAQQACVGVYPLSADDAFDLNSYRYAGISGSDGSFQFQNVTPGTYRVAFGDCAIANVGGFPNYGVEVFSDKPTLSKGDSVVVSSGGTTVVDAEVALGGKIKGTVSDGGGAVAGVCVGAVDPSNGDLVSVDVTEGDGSYTLVAVPAGSWAVRFFTDDSRCGAGGLQSEYYDDAPDRASANLVAVTASSTVTGIDALLAPQGPDGDGDGIADAVDTTPGTASNSFDDGSGTSGTITDRAGLDVTVEDAAAPNGVRVTVGLGSGSISISACSQTVAIAAGSDAVITCGSVKVQVVTGSAKIVLGDGVTVVSILAGSTAKVSSQPNGTFKIENVGDGSVEVTVDGVSRTIEAGDSADVTTWHFVGFSAPVDNPDALNRVKAGQAVPLKWRLLDAAGDPVTDLTEVGLKAVSLPCSEGESTDQLEETAPGGSGLKNHGNGHYSINWKTPKSYADSCKTLRLDLGEGIIRDALFRFTK